MKRSVLLAFLALVAVAFPCFAQDTYGILKDFFALSGDDFFIDSKSATYTERAFFASVRESDVNPADGRLSLAEYIRMRAEAQPSMVSQFTIAIARLLPTLEDFSFGQKDDYIARGVLKTAHALNKGLLLPAGSELRIMSYGTLRVYAPGPTVTLAGLPIRSGTATPIDFYCGSPQGLFLGQFQLAEDRVINGIPCKAKAVEEWNVSTELYENGNVHRATLASATTIDGIAFLPDEIIKLGWDGELESATILSSRNIAGKAVVAYQSGDPAKGLWSGSRPNLYMSKGVLVSCYQENFMVGKTVINGINLYHYSADGKTLSGMTVLSPYFLGYPVSLGKSLYPWEWEVSQSDILFSGSTASFTIDAGLALNGKCTSQLLESGTKLIIDTAGFFCIHAELPDGQSFRWTKADAMKAPLLEGEQLYLQIAAWMEQWLKANPENPSDDSRTRLVLSHASILNSAKAELTRIQHSKFILEILGDILVYKKKGGPLAPGSVGLDMNGNKRLEESELVPSFASTTGAKLFSSEEILAYLLEHGIGALPKQSLAAMGIAMGKAQPFAWRSDSLGILDSLGSTLSSLGVHPFADRRIYYFPNGSGDKMLCDTIEFYPSGMPSLLTIDSSELGANDVGGTNETVSFTVPGGSKARVWLYAQHRVQRAKDHAQDEAFWASAGIAQWYWSQINVLRFHESGQIWSIKGVPFMQAEFVLPSGMSWTKGESPWLSAHIVEWNPDGEIYAMYPGTDGYFTMPGGVRVYNPMWLNAWSNVPYGRFRVETFPETPFSISFAKGTYTLYTWTGEQWSPYTKEFTKDTVLSVHGFMVTMDGTITNYW